MSSISIVNRNESYKEILKNLAQKQAEVFNCLKENGSMNSQEIKEKLNFKDKCSITGRLKELEQKGLIAVAGSFRGKSVYRVNSEENTLNYRNTFKEMYSKNLKDLEEDSEKELSLYSLNLIQNEIKKLKKLINLLS